MPFKLEVLRGATVYDISAGNAIAIENVDDVGGASVRNQEESGPYQDGSSHLGERLEPRTMTLRLNVIGATDAALDGHRDTLNAMFKPIRSPNVPITLRLTRDDGEIRQVDTWRTGPLNIPLEKMNRPGHLHRAVVQLRATDPTFYGPTEQGVEFDGPSLNWWTGFGAIAGGDVLEHVENPSQGQLWVNSGSVANGSAWTVFFRSGSVTPNADGIADLAFYMSVPSTNGHDFRAQISQPGGYAFTAESNYLVTGAIMGAGSADYFFIQNGGTAQVYQGTVLVNSDVTGTPKGIETSTAGSARWRSDRNNSAANYWPAALPYAAAYNGALSASQRAALSAAIAGTAGSVFSAPIAYEGDWDSYPVITITGPVTNPVITNTTTGETLDFTGGTVNSGSVWVIDTRYGYKSVLSGTVSVEHYLSNSSDLATFHLAPDPVAAGGTNIITLTGTATGTATLIEATYYNRYMGF